MVSILFMVAFVGVLPLLLGVLLEQIFGRQTKGRMNRYLTGTLLFFTLAELTGVATVKLNFSLETYMTLFAGICAVLLFASLFLCRKTVSQVLNGLQQSMRLCRSTFYMTVLFLLLLSVIWIYQPYDMNDTMMETVRTTLATNTLFEYNPLTGEQMTNGMYPVNQLSVLPLFYAVLSQMSGMDVAVLLDWFVPAWVLFLHLGVMWLWGTKVHAKPSYILWYALLLLFSINEKSALGFRLLHQGYLGNVILLLVVLPYALYRLVEWATARKAKLGMERKSLRFALPGWLYATVIVVITIATVVCVTNLTMLGNLIKIDSFSIGTMLLLLLWRILSRSHEKPQKGYILGVSYVKAAMFLLLWTSCLLTGLWIPFAAYAAAEVTCMTTPKHRTLCIGVAVLIIFGQGVWCYATGDAVLRDGTKTAEEETVMRLIEIAQELEDPLPRLAAPRSIMELVRKETAQIALPYGRDYWTPDLNREIGDIYNDVAYTLYANIVNMEAMDETGIRAGAVELSVQEVLSLVAGNAVLNECDLLVTTAEMDLTEITKAVFLEEINGYYIYHMIQ